MATIRRNKYGKIHYAKLITGTAIAVLTDDPAAAAEIDEATARAIVDAHKASGARGQLQVLDAKGKVLASYGDPGEPPPPPKPVFSLPGLAERVEKLEERVEMIEASDAGGTTPKPAASVIGDPKVKEWVESIAKAANEVVAKELGEAVGKLVTAKVDEAIAKLKQVRPEAGDGKATEKTEPEKQPEKEPATKSHGHGGGHHEKKAG